MKIRIIKEFRGPGFITRVGETADSKRSEEPDKAEEWYKWLIDNGFAEEVKESGWWKPKRSEIYYFIDDAGYINFTNWTNEPWEVGRFAIGNCFKTRESAQRFVDYLKAIATVRQDEGVLTLKQIRDVFIKHYRWVFIIINDIVRCRKYVADDRLIRPGDVCFDTKEHAQASLDKHPDEWKTIANYDWSRE